MLAKQRHELLCGDDERDKVNRRKRSLEQPT
jgi:hypothetical protein